MKIETIVDTCVHPAARREDTQEKGLVWVVSWKCGLHEQVVLAVCQAQLVQILVQLPPGRHIVVKVGRPELPAPI